MTHGHDHEKHGSHEGQGERAATNATLAPLLAVMTRSPRVWLRCAAGDHAATALILSRFANDVLAQGFGDPLPSSREVAFAVDALAARTPQALQRLAGGWPAPKEARHLGVYRAALRAAARHLAATQRLMKHDLQEALLVEEARALFGTSVIDIASFDRLVGQPIEWLDARMIDRTKRTTEGVTRVALEAATPQHLRAIRHLGASFSDEHQRWLLHTLARESAGTERYLAIVELGLGAPSAETRAAVLATASRALAALVASDATAPALESTCFVVVTPRFTSP